MIEVLERFDNRTAAGLLARAAMIMENKTTPTNLTLIRDEGEILKIVVNEARFRLGISPDDNSPDAAEKLINFFDDESERLIEPPDTAAALERLAERGDLPSDLYKIDVIQNIKQFHEKNFDLEARLIEMTIRNPGREQHYGPPTFRGTPYMISLFAREFRTPWPFKDFTLLVAANRQKLVLTVHQAWRLYPSYVDARGTDLVELLRRFADVYGNDIEIDDKRGHFFLWANKPLPKQIPIITRGRRFEIMVSQFTQNLTSDEPQAALIVAIDLDKYRQLLKSMWVNSENIS